MRPFISGFITAFVVLIAGAIAYCALGLAPVATKAAAFPFEKLITGIALHARIDKEAPKSAPISPSPDVYASGAGTYRMHCAVCHGLPGQPESAIASGMYPPVPQLFKGKGVTDDTPGETYWKVNNGIRLTGMPGFKDSLTDQQIWQVSLLLANADKLPPSVLTTLQAALP